MRSVYFWVSTLQHETYNSYDFWSEYRKFCMKNFKKSYCGFQVLSFKKKVGFEKKFSWQGGLGITFDTTNIYFEYEDVICKQSLTFILNSFQIETVLSDAKTCGIRPKANIYVSSWKFQLS